MKIACVQFAPLHKDAEANLRLVTTLLREAEPADLYVLPELSLSGYAFVSTDEARPFATTEKSLKRVLALAKELDSAIVIGLIEAEGEKFYNAALLISREGRVILRYRKVHLFYYEKEVFSAGDLGFPVAELTTASGETASVGIQICYDWRFPEATRSLALAGAEIVAMPSNIVTSTGMLLPTLRTRAFENKVVVAFADRTESEVLATIPPEMLLFRGESAIINYNGEVLVKSSISENTIIYSELNPSESRKKCINIYNDILKDRNPSVYRQATKN